MIRHTTPPVRRYGPSAQPIHDADDLPKDHVSRMCSALKIYFRRHDPGPLIAIYPPQAHDHPEGFFIRREHQKMHTAMAGSEISNTLYSYSVYHPAHINDRH
ncbi:hypothetical protein Hypma_009767 [Hypsizygus marmoreus]|uniref:Uncharacterized protein n=1 Tax=Hypsizygus marmoreus TaxID=39966 RepID=A0A369JW84_HYPMA|nr:hypothetical protein Hypma_009767 [Hypsizygus marmoreus]